MKKVLFIAAILVLMLQIPAFAEVKIGVVNVKKAVLVSDYGQEMENKLKVKFEPMQQEIEREAVAIRKLESEMKNQDLALKLDAKQDRQRELRRRIRDHQDSVVAYRQKLQADNQKLRQPILEKLGNVIQAYGNANGYTVILQVTPGVLYGAQGVDLTDAIIAELNKMKKAGK